MDRRVFVSGAATGLITGFVPWSRAATEDRGLLGYIRTNWSRDPYSYGSYSYYPKGISIRKGKKQLSAPVAGKVYFAGEAFFPSHSSTVHSAYESGLRTAKTVRKSGVRRVAIVGAGMSGLSAAHRLSSDGLDVTVFEGRDHIGGRIRTSTKLGAAVDLGASWIHGDRGNPITRLAKSSDLKLVATDLTYATRGKGGRLIPDSQYPSWLEEVAEIQHEAGADLDQLNMAAYQGEGGYSGKEIIFPNGYIGVFAALKGNYEIRFSNAVERIEYNGKKVAIQTSIGKTEPFDAVIVTVSLGVLKKGKLHFDPELPAAKTDAINQWGMGTLDKVYLQFSEPFWDEDRSWILTPENDLPRGQFNQWLNVYKYLGKPILMAFNGGTPALDLAKLSDKEVVGRALQTLQFAYPN